MKKSLLLLLMLYSSVAFSMQQKQISNLLQLLTKVKSLKNTTKLEFPKTYTDVMSDLTHTYVQEKIKALFPDINNDREGFAEKVIEYIAKKIETIKELTINPYCFHDKKDMTKNYLFTHFISNLNLDKLTLTIKREFVFKEQKSVGYQAFNIYEKKNVLPKNIDALTKKLKVVIQYYD